MAHLLEWSRAYTGRLQKGETASYQEKGKPLQKRLADEISAGTLPFLSMPYRARLVEDMARALPKVRPYKHMLLLGIGGSALGCRAIQRAFAPSQDMPNHTGPSVWVMDNVSAEQLEATLSRLDPKETVVVTISKSGGTIETIAQYFLVKEWLKGALGDAWRDQMVVITDSNKGYLREEANTYQFVSLEVPDYLGGRYSALSAVGLLPAAYLGIDWVALLPPPWYRMRVPSCRILHTLWPRGLISLCCMATASSSFSVISRSGPCTVRGLPSSGQKVLGKKERAVSPCLPQA